MVGDKGNLLPVYVMADESGSMTKVMDELNGGLRSLHEALLGEPMAAAKVRFSVLGFSESVLVHLRLADLRREDEMPLLSARGRTSYGAAFADLRQRIPADVRALKAEGFTVHRPAVFFLSDGQPTDSGWREIHRQLVDRSVTVGAPNIIACGIGEAEAATIGQVATREEYGFVAEAGVEVGAAIATFCTALTKSIVESGRSLGSAQPELVVERPQGFRMAIDVV
ncbi:vWA domain-containing protein [Micromonospora carbonacea]|uniref:vWA domain-containing protein n=1 Tax=Micromonospora carbonacea TaxID=47853 RepID=UPI0037160B6F